MDQAIFKAKALIEALSYIKEYKNRIVVIKLGGSLMETDQSQRELLRDVVFMATVGMKPILVHGGGKSISAAMKKANIKPNFIGGIRYTDERTLNIAEHVLCSEINTQIVDTINDLGGQALGMHTLSSCALFAKQTRMENSDGRKIDLGMVGEITNINAHLLEALCGAGTIPVIAPIARDPSGGKLNVNADTAAGEVAASVVSNKLVMMSDTHGVFKDQNDPDSHVSQLNRKDVKKLIDENIITGGMLPKVAACLSALEAGVARTHIIDGSFAHSLLLEIFTDKGLGTLITQK